MTTTPRRVRRAFAGATLALALAVGVASPATAAPAETIIDPEPPVPTTFVYGEYWSLDFRSSIDVSPYRALTVETKGLPQAPSSLGWFANPDPGPGGTVRVFPVDDNWKLDAGSYAVNIEVWAANFAATEVRGSSRSPHTLVIQPANLVSDLRVVPDNADPRNSVVTVRLGGTWLDDVAGPGYLTDWGRENPDRVLAPPAGIWQLTIRDSDSNVVIEHEANQSQETFPAVSFLWADSPIAEPFTAEASFTPTGEGIENFTVTQSSPVAFTTGDDSRPVIQTPTVTDEPVAPTPNGVSVPLWAMMLALTVGLGAGVAGVVISARARRTAAVSPHIDDVEKLPGEHPNTADSPVGVDVPAKPGETP